MYDYKSAVRCARSIPPRVVLEAYHTPLYFIAFPYISCGVDTNRPGTLPPPSHPPSLPTLGAPPSPLAHAFLKPTPSPNALPPQAARNNQIVRVHICTETMGKKLVIIAFITQQLHQQQHQQQNLKISHTQIRKRRKRRCRC